MPVIFVFHVIECALHVCLCCASVYACMHVTLRVSQGICSGVSVCVHAWGSVFEECTCVEMRDSITIARKHRSSELTIDHLLHCA